MATNNPYDCPTGSAGLSVRVAHRPWLLRACLLSAIGLVVALLGLTYGTLLVGVPSQDPTPEMARREAFHMTIAGWVMAIGAGLLLCGILACLSVLVFRGVLRISGRRRPT